MTWIWVEDKDTGHRYDVRHDVLDESLHKRLDLKAYPDLDAPGEMPRAAQYRTDKAGSPAPKGGASASSDKAGQPATSKETDR
jgi:hypothetical protein